MKGYFKLWSKIPVLLSFLLVMKATEMLFHIRKTFAVVNICLFIAWLQCMYNTIQKVFITTPTPNSIIPNVQINFKDKIQTKKIITDLPFM